MDDLDRLFFELVETLRRERPAALAGPMTVGELHERVIPYRRVRDPVGFRSNDDYESAFCRLAAGERSYLLGDRVMQQELRAALDDLLPDIHSYRAYKDEQVWLNPAAIPPPGDTRYAPPDLRERSAAMAAAEERDVGNEGIVEAADDGTDDAEPVGRAESGQGGSGPSQGAASRAVEDTTSGETSLDDGPFDSCPTCKERLPENAGFCPFCGSRLPPASCAECGSELEPTWRFCPACGNRRKGPQGPA